ncbi:unnamed protein product [Fusarium langsethiae]|nr:unnamed protein product [Fusarium langsethiae]
MEYGIWIESLQQQGAYPPPPVSPYDPQQGQQQFQGQQNYGQYPPQQYHEAPGTTSSPPPHQYHEAPGTTSSPPPQHQPYPVQGYPQQ